MNPWVTWAAAVTAMVAGVLTMFFLRDRPRWAARMGGVMAGAGVVALANEALRPDPTAYIGIWVLVAGVTLVNWTTCQRAEREHHRRVMETLELLADLQRMQADRARLIERGERTWPPKEC